MTDTEKRDTFVLHISVAFKYFITSNIAKLHDCPVPNAVAVKVPHPLQKWESCTVI